MPGGTGLAGGQNAPQGSSLGLVGGLAAVPGTDGDGEDAEREPDGVGAGDELGGEEHGDLDMMQEWGDGVVGPWGMPDEEEGEEGGAWCDVAGGPEGHAADLQALQAQGVQQRKQQVVSSGLHSQGHASPARGGVAMTSAMGVTAGGTAGAAVAASPPGTQGAASGTAEAQAAAAATEAAVLLPPGRWKRVLGVRATGWTFSKGGRVRVWWQRGPLPTGLMSVPYSEHSSWVDLCDCVKSLRPKRLVPTVGVETQAKFKAMIEK